MPIPKLTKDTKLAVSIIFWLHVFLLWFLGFALVCRYWIAPLFP